MATCPTDVAKRGCRGCFPVGVSDPRLARSVWYARGDARDGHWRFRVSNSRGCQQGGCEAPWTSRGVPPVGGRPRCPEAGQRHHVIGGPISPRHVGHQLLVASLRDVAHESVRPHVLQHSLDQLLFCRALWVDVAAGLREAP